MNTLLRLGNRVSNDFEQLMFYDKSAQPITKGRSQITLSKAKSCVQEGKVYSLASTPVKW
jgi:hypothetical protein